MTARTGYAGGEGAGPKDMVCYHGGPKDTMYGDYHYAEAVQVRDYHYAEAVQVSSSSSPKIITAPHPARHT